MVLYSWQDIHEVPDSPGVYAWYYRHQLGTWDINQISAQVTELNQKGQTDQAERVVRTFLETKLFRPFMEMPYKAVIRGALKPTYRGDLAHDLPISGDVVRRISEDPGRLFFIKQVLENAVPRFSSPIYIGMSDRLRRRLLKHKHLINSYLEDGLYTPIGPTEVADQSFAKQVVRRGFDVTRLAVTVQPIEATANEHLDVENILNRINFPLCGSQ